MATTDGVVRAPSWLGMTTGSPPCITATTELVVPRSIPIILLIATIPPESSCLAIWLRPYLSEIKANPAQFSRPKPSSSRSIHVECMVVKFYGNRYNLFIFIMLQHDLVFFGCVPTSPERPP